MIRIKYRRKTDNKVVGRLKNKSRIRKKVSGTSERPRLCVFRSGKHLYAQIIDDQKGQTIVAASTLTIEGASSKKNVEAAKRVGEEVAKAALKKNINSVVFDRSGYIYHGKVKAIAESARQAGLSF